MTSVAEKLAELVALGQTKERDRAVVGVTLDALRALLRNPASVDTTDDNHLVRLTTLPNPYPKKEAKP